MIIDLENLSSEPDILHKMICALNTKVLSLTEENQSLKDQLALLKAKRFGASSEKLDKQIEELEQRIESNELDELTQKSQEERDQDKNIKPKPHCNSKRLKIAEHLPREDVVLNPDLECPDCGGQNFRKINEDISETLEYVPASFKVIRHIRPRCACTDCEKIVQAFAPSKAIEKGKAGSGLLAHIMVQKYCNHLPMYRQSQMYAREGIEISRNTMTGWAAQCSKLLDLLIDKLKQSVFASEYLHGDDTTIKVLAPGVGKTKTGRIWVYVRDGRPCGDDSPPAVVYYYSEDRKGERPAAHLKEFNGVLHADAYPGYDSLYISDKNPDATISEAACWAHTRRKFYEVTVANDKANIAISVLEQISEIYKIEADIRGLDPDQRVENRQQHSKKLVDELFSNLKKHRNSLPQKSSTVKAINYAMNNQVALMRFLGDGQIEIDNNAAERAMRGIALGRKNWMFAGSDRGGHTAANIYSLIETAKLNNINPWKYLEKVFDVIQDYNSNKLHELLPWNITL
jgi:transposase